MTISDHEREKRRTARQLAAQFKAARAARARFPQLCRYELRQRAAADVLSTKRI